MTLALTANLVEERLAVSTRWFGDPADEAALDGTVARLVGDVSRMLDRLEPATVVPGWARVDPRRPPVVLPRRVIPGCSLVVQVAEWSESVGCWWSLAATR